MLITDSLKIHLLKTTTTTLYILFSRPFPLQKQNGETEYFFWQSNTFFSKQKFETSYNKLLSLGFEVLYIETQIPKFFATNHFWENEKKED